MKPEKIKEHIDDKVVSFLEKNSLPQSLYYLDDLIDNFMSRESFINYDEKYLTDNWNKIPIRTRYTSYYVLVLLERRKTIKWLIENKYNRLTDFNDKHKYKLVLLKEKIYSSYKTI
jgi:hypothetical protein